MVDRITDTADKTLSDHRAHRAAHEAELKRGGNHRVMLQLTGHHDQSVGFRGFRAGFSDTLRVGLGVNKLERVFREDFSADFFFRAIVVEERLETGAGPHSHVIAALRAHHERGFQFVTVDYLITFRAFVPEAFRNAALRRVGFFLDFRSKAVNPAHRKLPFA